MIDRALDQRRTIVDGNDLDAGRQSGLQLLEPRLHRLDRLPCVLSGAQHDDAADDLAFTVELGDAAAHFRPELDPRDILEEHGRAAFGHLHRNRAEIVERFEIAARAHHVLGLRQLDHRAAGLLIGAADGGDHFAERKVVGLQARRIDDHLVLAHHAADRGDFRDIGQRLQLVFEKPVLQRAQLCEIVSAGAIHQRVLVDPAHARRVRA